MNRLTRGLLALGLAGTLGVGVTTAFAQAKAEDGAKPEMHSRHRMGGHFKALNLTDEQKAKLAELRKASGEHFKAIRESGATEDEKKQQMQQARKESREQMLDVLTPEQRTQMQTTRRGHGRMFGREGGRFGGGMGFGRMEKMLNLTPEQKKKMQAARERFHAEAMSILTPEQRDRKSVV